eukprot:GEMP01009807.1.p1 GENE.GEMP01009807.1~~GEMP01009807.1.p1  ORF type:complete len:683 (+),score=83.56 GEMP01009807.1:129-2177(+)
MFFSVLCFMVCPGINGHKDGAYCFGNDCEWSERKEWMKPFNNDTKLYDLSIPGTHQTMAVFGGDAWTTQSMSLKLQLERGIRALDIRSRHISDSFAIHHGSVYQEARFGTNVVEVCRDFLLRNPSETIIMKVKEEYIPRSITRSFDDTLEWYTDTVYSNDFYHGSLNPQLSLGEVRGKIVLFKESNKDQIVEQNSQVITSISGLYDKWTQVKTHLDKSKNEQLNEKLYVHYIGRHEGDSGVFAYFVASGHSSPQTGAPRLSTGIPSWWNTDKYPGFPRLGCVGSWCTIFYEGTNILTATYLKSIGDDTKRVGIVFADFPGDSLISSIITQNAIARKVTPNIDDKDIVESTSTTSTTITTSTTMSTASSAESTSTTSTTITTSTTMSTASSAESTSTTSTTITTSTTMSTASSADQTSTMSTTSTASTTEPTTSSAADATIMTTTVKSTTVAATSAPVDEAETSTTSSSTTTTVTSKPTTAAPTTTSTGETDATIMTTTVKSTTVAATSAPVDEAETSTTSSSTTTTVTSKPTTAAPTTTSTGETPVTHKGSSTTPTITPKSTTVALPTASEDEGCDPEDCKEGTDCCVSEGDTRDTSSSAAAAAETADGLAQGIPMWLLILAAALLLLALLCLLCCCCCRNKQQKVPFAEDTMMRPNGTASATAKHQEDRDMLAPDDRIALE